MTILPDTDCNSCGYSEFRASNGNLVITSPSRIPSGLEPVEEGQCLRRVIEQGAPVSGDFRAVCPKTGKVMNISVFRAKQ